MAERNELIKKLKISERSNQVLREALEEKNVSRSGIVAGGGEDDTNTLKSLYKSVGLSGGVGSSSTGSGGSGESSGEKALLLQPRKELLGEKSSRVSAAPALAARGGGGGGTALTTRPSRRQQQEESQQESRFAQIARITTEQKFIQKKIKNLKQILSVAKMDNYLQNLPSHHGLEKLALEMETLELRSNQCRKEMRELQIQVVTTTNLNSKKNGQHYEKIKLKSSASTSSSIISSSSLASSAAAAAAAAASSIREKRSSPYQSTTTSSFSSSPSSYSSLVDAGSDPSRDISRVAASVALHRFYSKRAPEKTVGFLFYYTFMFIFSF